MIRAKLRRILQRRDEPKAGARPLTWVPPGHYYSPIPSVEEIRRKRNEIWQQPLPPRSLAGIELNEAAQMELFDKLASYYGEQPFTAHKQAGLRYFFDNSNFSYSDAIFLYCLLRHLQPRRMIEIGSGYSSCVALDTNELFLNQAMSCTFIEPDPRLLFSLIKSEDENRISVIAAKVQDVDINLFSELSEADILFIDSTHVSKTLSDVNHILFNILPRLRSGVYIHFHDIFYPFVYPEEWEYEGRAWNESYIVRAFLQYNSAFSIILYNTFLEYFHEDEFLKKMPLCMKQTGGSLWIKKL